MRSCSFGRLFLHCDRAQIIRNSKWLVPKSSLSSGAVHILYVFYSIYILAYIFYFIKYFAQFWKGRIFETEWLFNAHLGEILNVLRICAILLRELILN